jgi:DNA-binding transcriptional LysR family regulator
MNLIDLDTFVQAADAGTFQGAAEQLGVPTSTVSRRIARLEDELGLSLFLRGGRRPQLTAEGRQVALRARPSLTELRALQRSLDTADDVPAGSLRITGPTDFCSAAPFIELIASFHARYPAVRLHLELTARNVDLVQEGYDIAFRPHGRQLRAAPGLMARRIGRLSAGLYARPDLVTEPVRGVADLPARLLVHSAVVDRWPHPEQVRVTANTFDALLEMAVHGAGIAVAPRFAGDARVRDGELVRLLPEVPLGETGALSVLWPESRHLSRRVRAFLDHVFAYTRDDPTWTLT